MKFFVKEMGINIEDRVSVYKKYGGYLI